MKFIKPSLCALTLSLLVLPGCELLGAGGGGAPSRLLPSLDMGTPVLTRSPSIGDIAAFYCPELLGDPISALACSATLGPPPPEELLRFDFDLVFQVDNPNDIPVPATEILAAIEVFAGQAQSELGAVCVQLCEAGTPGCTGAPGPESCRDDQADIRSLEDFASAAVGLLVAAAGAAATGELDNLLVRTIPPFATDFEIRVRFSLGVKAMIELLRHFVGTAVQELLANRSFVLEIPYSVRGTIWFQIPLFGRVALGFGDFLGTWEVGP